MSENNTPESAKDQIAAPHPDVETPEGDLRSSADRPRREAEMARKVTRQDLELAYQKTKMEARLLYEAGQLLGSTLDPQTIFNTIRQLVSDIMPVDSLLVSSFDSQTNLISCSYAWVEGNRLDVSEFPAIPLSPDGRGMQSSVILTGQPLLILDALERAMSSRSHYHVDPDGTVHDQPVEQKPQSRSILMVPIKLDGQVLGVVQLQSLMKGAYSEDDLRILEAIVLQMAAANRNAFLYQQVKEELAERERTEQALRESEAKYRDLVETSHDLIWSLAPDGHILFVNQAAERILGYPPSEMIGRPIVDFFADEQARKTLAAFAQKLREGTPMRFVARFRHKSGPLIMLSINGVPLWDAEGNLQGATGTATDITEQRRLQEQLLQAQKMEVVGQLAGGIAHDFNNLITVILGHASLALMDLGAESGTISDLTRIQQAAHRAAELTQQLLAFARKQVTEPKVVNLNDLILDVHKMLRPLIGADIELIFVPRADPAYIRIDPGQFEQVLINLTVNARDAMPNGGKLTIATDNVTLNKSYEHLNMTDKIGEYLVMAVTDTGSGMTPEVQTHIFEPFFTTKEVSKGTGLGLATCYGIVQQSGGYIEVESEPGQGTTFRIFLPRIEASAMPAHPTEAAHVLPRGTETLLLVEDNSMVRESVMRALQPLGYTMLEASNGDEALRLIAAYEGKIDLVITDIIMPEMGGVELVERLLEIHPEIPVLFTSGYPDTAFAQGGPQLSREKAFLQKPFTPYSLARKARQVLDSSP